MPSWIESANLPACDFPIENLPYGVFKTETAKPAIGIAIGDFILDLRACAEVGLLSAGSLNTALVNDDLRDACTASILNPLMSLGRAQWRALRQRVIELLANKKYRDTVQPHLVRQSVAQMLLPAAIGNYSDFFASIYHAENVGRIFRPGASFAPNYK